MQSTPSFSSLPGPLWPGVIAAAALVHICNILSQGRRKNVSFSQNKALTSLFLESSKTSLCVRKIVTDSRRGRTLKQTGGGLLYWPLLLNPNMLPYSEPYLALLFIVRERHFSLLGTRWPFSVNDHNTHRVLVV